MSTLIYHRHTEILVPPVQLTCAPDLLGGSIDLMSKSMLFQRLVNAGLLYHGTIPDSGQRSNVRMADDEVLKTVSLRRKI